jgi:N-dimethylarginine dimethylaminohydrolase
MKPAHRQAEPEYTAGFVTGLGWEAEQVSAVWEAQGDALRVGRGKVLHTFGEGPMARTEEAAQAEVAQKLGGEALGVRFVADPWFHGNTFMGYYESPDARKAVLLLCASALCFGELERVEAFVRHAQIVPITPADSLGYATNALQVGSTVIAPSGLGGHILEVWRWLGLEVVELDLSQLFRKGGGAAVCLSCRLYGLDEAEVPAWARYGEAWRARLLEMLPTYEGE